MQEYLLTVETSDPQRQALAQGVLGLCYEFGHEGVEQDYVKAAYWYGRAAELGDQKGKDNLERIYKQGKLVK